jgi:hypothetical protein
LKKLILMAIVLWLSLVTIIAQDEVSCSYWELIEVEGSVEVINVSLAQTLQNFNDASIVQIEKLIVGDSTTLLTTDYALIPQKNGSENVIEISFPTDEGNAFTVGLCTGEVVQMADSLTVTWSAQPEWVVGEITCLLVAKFEFLGESVENATMAHRGFYLGLDPERSMTPPQIELMESLGGLEFPAWQFEWEGNRVTYMPNYSEMPEESPLAVLGFSGNSFTIDYLSGTKDIFGVSFAGSATQVESTYYACRA